MGKIKLAALLAVPVLAVGALPAAGHDVAMGQPGHGDCNSTDNNLNYWLVQGNDQANGCTGHESFEANNGNDHMYGYAGPDSLSGLGGADEIRGGDGNDTLRGAHGNDTILDTSGGDADRACDGAGSDTVDFRDGDGNDIVYKILDQDPDNIQVNDSLGDLVLERSSCPV